MPLLVQIMACRLVDARAIIWSNAGYCWSDFRNKFQWDFNRNSYIFIQENAFENAWKWMIEILLKFVPKGPINNPDSKVRGANIGPTRVLSAPDGPHVGPTNLVIRGYSNIGSGHVVPDRCPLPKRPQGSVPLLPERKTTYKCTHLNCIGSEN